MESTKTVNLLMKEPIRATSIRNLYQYNAKLNRRFSV